MDAVVTVVDAEALTAAAERVIDEVEFSDPSSDVGSGEQANAAVRGSLVDGVLWAIDVAGAIIGVPGVELEETSAEAVELDEDGLPAGAEPDFVELFPLCRCGRSSCDDCEGWQLTPRTAAALWSAAQILADHAYDDVENHGDDPVDLEQGWILFDQLPAVTWRQDAVWRRQAARAFDDLASDLAEGRRPLPRCFAEEMALHLVLEDAAAGVEDGWIEPSPQVIAGQTPHPDDYDWEMAGEVLFLDHDILTLFDPAFDGVEDPESEINERMRMGDMRPRAWFDTFGGAVPRDGRRPFRR